LSNPELTEPVEGIFILTSEYEDRAIPKKAGLRWHSGYKCRKKDCELCGHELLRVWHTSDVEIALQLLEFAPPELAAALIERAGSAGKEREEELKKAARALKIKKLAMASTYAASCAKDSEISVPHPAGLEYFPYQRAAIAFGLDHPNLLLADEMGLGKTIEALGLINADESAQRVLIVCPASLKLNWQRECETWLVNRGPVGVAGKKFPEDSNVVIINYDILRKWKKHLRGKWDVLIADECHYVKNKEAKRSKALYSLKAKRKVFLTGTPILNRPIELWAIVNTLAPEEFDQFWNFAKRYCKPTKCRYGWDFKGVANLDELHYRLRGTIMVRRTKAEVLPELPPKRRQVIELASDHITKLIAVETGAWEEHQRRLRELRSKSREGGQETEAELAALRAGINAAFGELAKIRQSTALAKVPLVIEHIKNVIDDAGKLVIFAHHRSVIAELAEPFGDEAVTLTGSDSIKARQAAVDRFQEDPTCKLFIGSITAAGFGLTLTASSHVLFAELDWVPAHMTQAEDRTHRIGQKDSVLVQHLVLQDSLDARMVGTLIKKQRVIDQVVDGSSEQDLFEGDFAQEIMEAAAAAATADAASKTKS
jgi:SWI/SNF-related matrix-associated actin-dependent regulator 1 of chromatin subfamily A